LRLPSPSRSAPSLPAPRRPSSGNRSPRPTSPPGTSRRCPTAKAGSGTAKLGAAIYSQKCALCHGENGVNPRPGYSPMVGPSKFDRIDTMKTVPYYKYATTLYDVMRRSMPYPIPKTLTSDELYALSAYILFLNKIVGEDEVMDANSLPRVKMPNRDNFIVWDQDKIEYDPIRMGAPR
jgi:cytochrome c